MKARRLMRYADRLLKELNKHGDDTKFLYGTGRFRGGDQGTVEDDIFIKLNIPKDAVDYIIRRLEDIKYIETYRENGLHYYDHENNVDHEDVIAQIKITKTGRMFISNRSFIS